MGFKGTKGKWSCILGNEQQFSKIIIGKKNYEIRLDLEQIEEEKANALLISKAPEMLEMLGKLCDELEFHKISLMAIQARQLIKEATEL